MLFRSEADGDEISTISDFSSVIKKHKGGDSILLRVKRTSGQVNLTALEIPE